MTNFKQQSARSGVAEDFERVMELVETMRDLAARYKDYAATLRQLQGRTS